MCREILLRKYREGENVGDISDISEISEIFKSDLHHNCMLARELLFLSSLSYPALRLYTHTKGYLIFSGASSHMPFHKIDGSIPISNTKHDLK
jgi:hypothetical protein